MNSMQRSRMNRRLAVFRAAVLAALLIGVAAIFAYALLPTTADLAAERKLIGKWGLYAPTSNLALPPDRIVEFLPQGQQASYSPELESWGRTIDNPTLKSNWWIRRGVFISTMQNPSQFQETIVERYPIAWIDDNNFVMTVKSPDSKAFAVRYRRIGQQEIDHIRATTSMALEPSGAGAGAGASQPPLQ